MSAAYDRKDHYYERAKESGFRSRAAFKLQELNAKYALLKPGFKVLDLGAWPGGWLQVAGQTVGARGKVVGIDLTEIEPVGRDNVVALTGDVRDQTILDQAISAAGGKFDLILSDMSTKLSGIKEVDQAASVGLGELALWVAKQALKPGGTVVVKLFKGSECDLFVKRSRPVFNKMIRAELKSTRKTSNEFYLVGFGYLASADGAD